MDFGFLQANDELKSGFAPPGEAVDELLGVQRSQERCAELQGISWGFNGEE
jgi:hypothetical protein